MIADDGTMVTLDQLKNEMKARGYTATTLSRLTPRSLPADRIADLMAQDIKRTPEPWLDEAYMLARVLGVGDIATLIGRPIETLEMVEDIRGDLTIWRTGCRLPLAHAIRLARSFGLSDPYDLYEVIRLRSANPIMTGLWQMTPALGECGWCGGSGDETPYHGHATTCTMNNLWGPRDLPTTVLGPTLPYPRNAGKRQNGLGRKAPGLRPLRKRLGVTQEFMATNVDCSLAHWCKMENLTSNLTPEMAHILIRKFPPLTMVDLYSAETVIVEK
jgi:hypothetical protein